MSEALIYLRYSALTALGFAIIGGIISGMLSARRETGQ